MNQLSHEPHNNGNSMCAELMIRAERELSAFFSAVAVLFGPEQAALAAKDWLNSWRSWQFCLPRLASGEC
jgi:hypothetical protein